MRLRSLSLASPKRPLFRRLGLLPELLVDLADDPEETLRAWQLHRPRILQGYPSALRLLAQYCLEHNRSLEPAPRLVFTDSELLLADTRALIEHTFRAPLIDVFGTFETDNIAYQCDRRTGYHVTPDSVVLEIVRDGVPVGPGEIGEIVVTVLHNRTTPFIRYNLHDLAAWATAPCSCGRTAPLLEVFAGRANDLLTYPDGRQLTPMGITAIFSERAHLLRQYQMAPKRRGAFRPFDRADSRVQRSRERVIAPRARRDARSRADRASHHGPHRARSVGQAPRLHPRAVREERCVTSGASSSIPARSHSARWSASLRTSPSSRYLPGCSAPACWRILDRHVGRCPARVVRGSRQHRTRHARIGPPARPGTHVDRYPAAAAVAARISAVGNRHSRRRRAVGPPAGARRDGERVRLSDSGVSGRHDFRAVHRHRAVRLVGARRCRVSGAGVAARRPCNSRRCRTRRHFGVPDPQRRRRSARGTRAVRTLLHHATLASLAAARRRDPPSRLRLLRAEDAERHLLARRLDHSQCAGTAGRGRPVRRRRPHHRRPEPAAGHLRQRGLSGAVAARQSSPRSKCAH